MEAGGKVLVEEKDSLTTVLVASRKFLEGQRDLARRFDSRPVKESPAVT
jgi:NitT/TauT family transport system substrate-binding protein